MRVKGVMPKSGTPPLEHRLAKLSEKLSFDNDDI